MNEVNENNEIKSNMNEVNENNEIKSNMNNWFMILIPMLFGLGWDFDMKKYCEMFLRMASLRDDYESLVNEIIETYNTIGDWTEEGVSYLMDYDTYCLNSGHERNPQIKQTLIDIYNKILAKEKRCFAELHFCIRFESFCAFEMQIMQNKMCCAATNTESQTEVKGPTEE